MWTADKLLVKEVDAGKVANEEATLHIRGSPHWTPLSSGWVLARYPLGGGAMNLAYLLGGGGLQTQINPLAGVLGGSTGILGMSGVPSELAGLCALLGNQQSHNVSLTNLQVVELPRAVAAQKLATEKQEAAAVQARIDEKVAEELKKVAPRATSLYNLWLDRL